MADRRTEDTDSSQSTDRGFVSPAFEREDGIDDLLALLSHRRRRRVLYYLSDRELADVGEVAAAVAAREADLEAERVSDEARTAVAIDLSHNHLPKLADRGVVDYDRRSGAVRWTTPPEALATLLECCRSLEDDYSERRS
ncbi:DUF7344 domain-containing protein [Natrononativus amylolyticus]|uniref:DUF7344 domain-containing protein n=1 Tax=Natrononativus amylolyticus TaxID=2963434 RepID=UPI0020CC995B|nr:hypothetical protein [Natrononativus amylolyticus]